MAKNRWLWILIIAACVFTTGFTAFENDKGRDGMFIHITHGKDDPHRVCMALQMAAIMADEHDVLVYFDIKGVEVTLKDAADISYSHFPSVKEQLEELPKKAVVLFTCPGCLKAAGKTPADLAEGIMIADKRKCFSFTKGRIITLDY